MEEVCRCSGLKLDVGKRTGTIFKRITPGEQQVTKVVGVHLESHLSMKAHAEATVKEARKRIAQIKKARAFLTDSKAIDRVQENFESDFHLKLDPLRIRQSVLHDLQACGRRHRPSADSTAVDFGYIGCVQEIGTNQYRPQSLAG